jgi:hypothetical protein
LDGLVTPTDHVTTNDPSIGRTNYSTHFLDVAISVT